MTSGTGDDMKTETCNIPPPQLQKQKTTVPQEHQRTVVEMDVDMKNFEAPLRSDPAFVCTIQ